MEDSQSTNKKFPTSSSPIIQAPVDNSKKKRRPRSAAGERNFVCGCSKAYLSYPALYTHVKNKHDGIFPEGSNLKKKGKKLGVDEVDPFTQEKNSYHNELRIFFKRIYNASVDTPCITKENLIDPFKGNEITPFGTQKEAYS